MKTFTLILSVLNYSGDLSEFAIQDNLTDMECGFLMSEWLPTLDEHSEIYCADMQ